MHTILPSFQMSPQHRKSASASRRFRRDAETRLGAQSCHYVVATGQFRRRAVTSLRNQICICQKPFLATQRRRMVANDPQNSMTYSMSVGAELFSLSHTFSTDQRNMGRGTIDTKIWTNTTINQCDYHTKTNAPRSNATMMTQFIVMIMITVTIKI